MGLKRTVRRLFGISVLILAAGRAVAADIPEEGERIDVTAPEKVKFQYSDFEEREKVISNEKVELILKSQDKESEVAFIYYEISDGREGKLEGTEGSLILEPEFRGTVNAYAVDQAGNQSEISTSKEIICESTTPEIVLDLHGTEGWNWDFVPVSVEIQDQEISSGLQSVKCYVNHEVVINEQIDLENAVSLWNGEFTVDIVSLNGSGIPIVVETTDYAGNIQMASRLVYIDRSYPQIEISGSYDKMISGEGVIMEIVAADENILENGKIMVWRNPPKQERSLYIEQMQEQAVPCQKNESGEGCVWKLVLEEDGVYEVEVTVQDAAGHQQVLHQTLTVDRTNPIIRFIEQMHGTHIPYFQWNYDVSEMIEEFTEYQYQMTLNGRMYTSGTYVEEEGEKLLSVEVIDAAGNRSTANAVFYIDHTPPEIQAYQLKDGGIYEESAELNLEVGEPGAYLEGVFINSEKINLTEDSQIFSQTLEEPGEYIVRARAKDLAGNKSELELKFRIEKRSLAAVLFKPVKKLLSEEGNQKEQKEVQKEEQKKETSDMEDGKRGMPERALGILIFTGILSGVGIAGYYEKVYSKIILSSISISNVLFDEFSIQIRSEERVIRK